jgi:hypothetical protein
MLWPVASATVLLAITCGSWHCSTPVCRLRANKAGIDNAGRVVFVYTCRYPNRGGPLL